jgi:hypothetical protein
MSTYISLLGRAAVVGLLSAFCGLAMAQEPALLEKAAPMHAAKRADAVVEFVHSLSSSYSIQPNLTYSTANNVELKLDLYLPQNTAGPVPLVVFFSRRWLGGGTQRGCGAFASAVSGNGICGR